MTETTVEKTVRNKFATSVCGIFMASLLWVICHNFYFLFHDPKTGAWDKILPALSLTGAFIAVLWLSLIMVASCMTLSGKSFKKTLPYSISLFFVIGVELLPRVWNASGYYRLFWSLLTLLASITILLQMLAFSLDAHSSSLFRVFRPFRIEILTVIRLSSQAPNTIGKDHLIKREPENNSNGGVLIYTDGNDRYR